MADTLRASSTGLKLVNQARRKKGWSKSSEIWAKEALTTKATLKRFWGRTAILQDTFKGICKAVGVSWREVVEEAEVPEHADRKYTALIKQGVPDWNRWRESQPYFRVDLNGVDLRGTNLKGVDFSDTSLKGADLREADLSHAILVEANLINADLSHANLSNADLSRTQALATNFTGTKLTGACLEDWNCNGATTLNDIVCDYIFLKARKQERCPSNGNFTSGEFTKLFHKAISSVDLILRNSIDQVNTLYEAEKIKIKYSLEQKYTVALKACEKKYQSQLKAKDEQIEIYREHNANMCEIVKLVASKPIEWNIKSELLESHTMESPTVVNVQGGQVSFGGDINTGEANVQYSSVQKQNLAEAVAEIQQLLKQLENTYGNKETAKVINTLKSGGVEALEAIDHPLVNILMAAIEGWAEA
ncbi:pentapeptide repeat-containing protein [Moorena sp. SIO3I6]|uniref:pentapeptide repeat-containing protein n=1 Tax=Moorena sp. SIO3I6 TaxID=2607831 RepID=UPI0013F74472|nr:pentapeptide repeat-containing protein [Moorena sp. SIO3I6]NEP23733.1 pentapeptide repeat-containing protein [Moorena sp. SIO3I6]